MPRKNKNAFNRFDKRLTFKEYCKVLGISPKQRVKIIKYLNDESR